jgi:peptide/nickel transport system permease protein
MSTATAIPAIGRGARARATRVPRVLRRIVARLTLGVLPVALVSSLTIFLLTHLTVGEPALIRLGDSATPTAVRALDRSWGWDRPLLAQYVSWLGNALHGDLGKSFMTNIPVSRSIGQCLPIDLSISLVALVLAIVVGASVGVLAAVRRDRLADRAITAISSVALTIPEFWLAILLVGVFSISLKWLPSSGYSTLAQGFLPWLRGIILPGVSLSVPLAAAIARQLRTSLVTALEEDYVVGARVRGLSSRRVLFGHVLRNAAGPTLVVIGLSVPPLLGGAVVAETVFGLPGLGQYAFAAAQNHDVPAIQGVLLVTVALVLVSNLLVDLLLVWLRAEVGRR